MGNVRTSLLPHAVEFYSATPNCDLASAVRARSSVQRVCYDAQMTYTIKCGSIVRLSKADTQHANNLHLLSCAHTRTRVAYTYSAK